MISKDSQATTDKKPIKKISKSCSISKKSINTFLDFWNISYVFEKKLKAINDRWRPMTMLKKDLTTNPKLDPINHYEDHTDKNLLKKLAEVGVSTIYMYLVEYTD